MTLINDIVLKRIRVGLIRLYENKLKLLLCIRHIDDVITCLRRRLEIGDHLQIKGKTSLKILI